MIRRKIQFINYFKRIISEISFYILCFLRFRHFIISLISAKRYYLCPNAVSIGYLEIGRTLDLEM